MAVKEDVTVGAIIRVEKLESKSIGTVTAHFIDDGTSQKYETVKILLPSQAIKKGPREAFVVLA